MKKNKLKNKNEDKKLLQNYSFNLHLVTKWIENKEVIVYPITSEPIQKFNVNDELVLVKQQELNSIAFPEIKICIEYELNGKKINYLPASSEDQFNVKPIYKTYLGWKTSTQGVRNMEELPENAKTYIHALEDFIGCKISSISTSPEREDTILIEDPFSV